MAIIDDPSATDDGTRSDVPALGVMTQGPRPADAERPEAEATLTGSLGGGRERPSLDETIAGDDVATREPTPTLEPGAVVGRHFLLQRLGAGGMGVVHAAYDPELDRKVALKLLRPGTGGPTGRTRLLREAQALAKLSHPNVVAIHDVGTVGEQVWLAMELVQGRTLGAWLGTPRRWQEVLAVMRSAGEGLAAAHAVGLLHRDFKPDNVMVGDDGRVRVMDFGLARVGPEATPVDTAELAALPVQGATTMQVTRLGAIVGTPGYMAPEQLGSGELTAAADQFSFCVTLWEALYGQRPFAGSTWMEVSDNVLSGKLRAPGKGRSVPGWLRRACERGLSRDPAQRWPSMTALLETLATGHTRARKRWKLLGAGALVLIGGSAEIHRRYDLARSTAQCEAGGEEIETAWSPAREQLLREALLATGVGHAATTADKTIAWLEPHASEWRAARVEACLDAEVRGRWDAAMLDRSLWCLDERRMELQSLVDELTQADAEVLQKAVTAAAGLASVAPCRDERALEVLAPPPEREREAIRAIRADVARASNLERAGRYERGLALARDALARAELLEWRPLSAAARLRVGSLLEKTGAFAEAEPMLADAYFEASEGLAPEVAFEAATALVLVVGNRSVRPAEGRLWGRLAELALASLREDESPRRAELLNNLASVDDAAGEYEQARERHERALAIREQTLGPNHPRVAASLKNLASVVPSTGAHAEAKPLGERAVAIYVEALGPDHPEVAFGLLELARIHGANGAHSEAKALLERAHAIAERALGSSHPHVGAILNNLARAHHALGDFEPAERLQRQALAIFEQELGPEHPNVAASVTDLANVLATTGAYDRAEPLYERALAIYEKVLGPRHPDVARSLGYLAKVHVATGEHARAIALNERALAIFEEAFGSDHADVATCLGYLARAHLATGDFARAASLYERSLAIYEKVLGPTHPFVGYALGNLAEVALARERPGDAVPLAERAVSVLDKSEDPARLAQARFLLARALWAAPADAGRDRARAAGLAGQARAELSGGGDAKLLAEVEAWLREHSLPGGAAERAEVERRPAERRDAP